MTLVALHRLASADPNATTCRLCDTPISCNTHDDLLVGQPGVAEVRAVICTRCGDALVRLDEVCGNQLNVLIKGDVLVSGTTLKRRLVSR